ncbi:DUF2537 domain-containing protein [Actinosynnema sp. NPDC047251]|uniref:Putative membrane protein n=1 Tax=Saccharothrix espanaensis (strain ATCC 51144 / DSM 44229 / JCM 9112 / NBRC 15066 / NRRL 15764) TaxID=1179773 RepID=K0JUF0_SACES|nr:DUF2537 domain-containing protein [Saccharothrix espanaensis]CCH27873.1 putative membrane protein [Saccharothrix espanaensis DSM 44229]
MELRVQDGRAVLAGRDDAGEREVDPHTLPLGAGLAEALHEWAKVAAAVVRSDASPDASPDDTAGELVALRGRQLASRVAADMGAPVAYTDPVTGEKHIIEAPALPPDPEPEPEEAPETEVPQEQTPWGTGLTVSLFTAAVVTFMVVTLSLGLGETSQWLALVANVLVVGGIAPSVWLARKVMVWRWVAYGVVAGVLIAWFALILTLLE